MAGERQKFHYDITVNLTLDELDAELSKSYSDPVKSRILEAIRAQGLASPTGIVPQDRPDGGTHFDMPHIDQN